MEIMLGLVLVLALLVTLWGWASKKTRSTRLGATKDDEMEPYDWAGNKLGCLLIAILIAVVVGVPIFILAF